MRKALAVLFSAAVLSCATTTAPTREWRQWRDAEAAGFDRAKIDAVCAQADTLRSGALMVVAHGNVVTACGDVARKLELHSVRKSIYSALYGIAVDKGLIRLDATLAELGIDDLQPLTEIEKRARVEDLLLARSGIYHPAAYAPADQDRAPARGTHAPGTNWFYNNWDFNVAGVLLERATGKKLGVLLDEWIAKPIGMEDFTPADVTEIYEPSASKYPALTIRMSTRDLARFGQMWLNEGRWNGNAIVPAPWVARASKAVSDAGNGTGYGMMWWTQMVGQHQVVAARGTGGQLIAVIPSTKMVIVHRGDTDHGRAVSGRSILELMNAILAARKGDPETTADTAPFTPVALTSQLPPMQWPQTITLDETVRNAIVGEYQFGPQRVGRIYVHNGRLFGYVPPLGDAELFAKSPTEFFIRVDPNAQVRVEGDKLTIKVRDREMVGTRIK